MTYTLSFIPESKALSSYPAREPSLDHRSSLKSGHFSRSNFTDRYTTPTERYSISDISSYRKQNGITNIPTSSKSLSSSSKRAENRPLSSSHVTLSRQKSTNDINRLKVRAFYQNKMETREKYYRKQVRELRRKVSQLEKDLKSSKVDLEKEKSTIRKQKQEIRLASEERKRLNRNNSRRRMKGDSKQISQSQPDPNRKCGCGGGVRKNMKTSISEEDMKKMSLKELNDLYNNMFTNMVKVQSFYAKKLIQKHKETIQNNCLVCMSETKNCLLLPCRHICTCKGCAEKLTCCPVCRKKIQQRILVYV